MTMINMNNAKFDAIARATQVKLTGAKSKTGKTFGFSKSRQLVAQSVFGKTYEEIVVNGLLTDVPALPDSNVVKLILFKYAEGFVLTLAGDYVACTGKGLFTPNTELELTEMGAALSEQHGVYLQTASLPQLLEPLKYTSKDVIELAKKMGYFTHNTTVFDLIEDSDTTILIDGKFCGYTLNGDWDGEIAMEASEYYECIADDPDDDSCDPYDFTIWNPELVDKEYFITFKGLCDAEPIDNEKTLWSVMTDIGSVHVSFKR